MSNVNKIIGIETGDISQVNDVNSNNISKVIGNKANFSKIPIGLIIPFNNTSIPIGWERFSNADDKHIIGAGNTYNVGDNSNGTNFSIGTTTTGNHSRTEYMVTKYDIIGGSYYAANQSVIAGNHSHIISGNYKPSSQQLIFIKSIIDNDIFPIDSIILTNTNNEPNNTNSCYTANQILGCGNAINSISAGSYDVSVSSSGSHVHVTTTHGEWDNYGSAKSQNLSSGAHSNHTITMSSFNVSNNTKRYFMRAWTNASNNFDLQNNMIGMYESLTPPKGWKLCNGLNGTPDLRDYFIELHNGVSTGSFSGNNTLNISAGAINQSSLSHSHRGQTRYDPWDFFSYGQHDYFSWAHAHNYSSQTIGYMPLYYALSFIMKI